MDFVDTGFKPKAATESLTRYLGKMEKIGQLEHGPTGQYTLSIFFTTDGKRQVLFSGQEGLEHV